MSKYEDYDTTSKIYDEQRLTMGSEVMVAMIQFHCRKPLKDIHVLDAGCGTGNYAKDFIQHGVGHMTLLDASPGMLEKAKSKLSDHVASGKIKDVIETTLPTLPFPDSTFDAVLFNLVLHHLETQAGDRGFTNTTEALKEARRVLKPNGLIIISTGLSYMYTHCIWFMQILPKLTEKLLRQFPYPDEWEHIFEAADIRCVQKMNLLGKGLMNGYYNFEGPLDDDWRNGSSYWALATPGEIEEVKSFVRNLKEKGELERWARAHDHIDSCGLLTVFALTHAKKL